METPRDCDSPREGKGPLRMGHGGKPKPTSLFCQGWSFPLALVESTLALQQEHWSSYTSSYDSNDGRTLLLRLHVVVCVSILVKI